MKIYLKYYRYLTLLLFFAAIVSCEDDEKIPQAASGFSADKTSAKVLEEIIFTNTSENATAFKWSFGDGTTSTEKSPAKRYAISGTYTVSLAATGRSGTALYHTDITVLAPDLYVTEVDTALIRKFIVDHPESLSAFKDVADIAGVGLAFDSVHQKIYFTDYQVTGEGKIWRMNADGTGLETIVDGLYDPYQIALDIADGKLYWAEDVDDDDIGHIGRANLDGSALEYVVSLEDGEFRAVAVDTKHGKLYYYEVNNEDLYRSNLDGSDAVVILPGVYGYGILVDEVHDKIYFDEQNEGVLYMADLDGGNAAIVDDGGSRIYGMVLDHEYGYLYWSGRDTGQVYRANLDGTDKTVLQTGLKEPAGIFLKK